MATAVRPVPGTAARAAGGQDPGPGGSAGFAPADVMAIRRMLEPSAMRLVVAWATASDFGEMDRCLAGGEQAASYDEFELWDLALHRCIVAASHSPLLGRLYDVVEEARHGRFWGELKRHSASRERQLVLPGRPPGARRSAAGQGCRPRGRGDAHAPGQGHQPPVRRDQLRPPARGRRPQGAMRWQSQASESG